MLKVEKYDAVIATLKEAEADELAKFIVEEKERYVNRQDKAKARAAQKRAEADAILDVVKDVVVNATEPLNRAEIADIVAEKYKGEKEITPAVVGARLNKLYKAGEIAKAQVVIAKARKMVYGPVGIFEEADEEEAE